MDCVNNPEKCSSSSLPVYYGWWVLAATAITEMLVIGSTSYGAGLFVLPLQRELSLSRAAANSALPIAFAGAALMAPLVGYLLDRFSARWLISIGAAVFGLGLIAISATSSIFLMIVALLVPVGFGGMAIGPLTTSTLAARWFHRRQGLALGIAAVATSAGGIVVVPLLTLAIGAFGWRRAIAADAISVIAITVALAVFVIRNRPADLGLEFHPENQHGSKSAPAIAVKIPLQWSYSRILSSANFWTVAFVLAVITGIDQAIVVTVVPYAIGLGFASVSAAFLISAFSISAAFAKVAAGLLADLVERRTIILTSTIAMIASLLLLLSPAGYALILFACCLAGTALGCILPSSSAFVAGYFGSHSFGRIMGMMYVPTVISSLVAAAFIGAIFDRTGNYRIAFLVFLALAGMSTVAAFAIRRLQQNSAEISQAAVLSASVSNIAAKGSPR